MNRDTVATIGAYLTAMQFIPNNVVYSSLEYGRVTVEVHNIVNNPYVSFIAQKFIDGKLDESNSVHSSLESALFAIGVPYLIPKDINNHVHP